MSRAATLTPDAIPADFAVQPIDPDDPTAKSPATCGTCGLTWDDGRVTSMTPTPSGRCPFEAFHEYDDDRLDLVFTVEISVPLEDGEPPEIAAADLAAAIYRGVDSIDSEDAVLVRRVHA